MIRVPDEPTIMAPASVAVPTLPCVYCHEPIEATTFAHWSATT
jgi:hypothetical protein